MYSFLFIFDLVMDRHYSPIVYHQSSPVGGTAIFRCNIPLDMKSYIRVYSWMAIYPGGAKKRYILRGTTVDNFHALSTGELVVSDVTESYRKYKFACQSQNIYSNLTFTSSPARLYPNRMIFIISCEHLLFLEKIIASVKQYVSWMYFHHLRNTHDSQHLVSKIFQENHGKGR